MSVSGFETRLVAAIEGRRGAMVEDLRRLVSIPTGRAPHPRAVEGLAQTRAIFADRLRGLGCVVEQAAGEERPGWLDGPGYFRSERGPDAPAPSGPEPILIARHEPGGADGGVLLSGHLDTVHDPAAGAAFRALSVSPDGRTATGPGVVDMKGGLVIALHALETLAELGALPRFSFVLNSDEETGSFSSDSALRREGARAARNGYAMALALEPAAGEGKSGLVTARGGSGQFLMTARGVAAHVGRNFAAGRSATDALARAIVAAHGLTDATAGRIVNVSTLMCDQPSNQVSDFAAAWGNLRYPDATTGEALRGGLGAISGVEVDARLIRPAKPATAANLALAERVRSLAARLGHEPVTFNSSAGVCDGNNVQAGGGEGLAVLDTLGVRGGGLHTTREWIDLSTMGERGVLLGVMMAGSGG